jgi:hypothetical protein
MGYDASVYLIYGIKITMNKNVNYDWLFQLMVPDLYEKYDEDTITSMDFKKRENGYLLAFDDVLYVASYYHEHDISDSTLTVTLPTEEEQSSFKIWCEEQNIGVPLFYTQLQERY